jgi:hypothetical protein
MDYTTNGTLPTTSRAAGANGSGAKNFRIVGTPKLAGRLPFLDRFNRFVSFAFDEKQLIQFEFRGCPLYPMISHERPERYANEAAFYLACCSLPERA